MNLVRKMMRGKCVYWAPTNTTNDANERILAAPVEIPCRWEADGAINDPTTVLYERYVGRVFFLREDALEPEGYLWNGLLVNLPVGLTPELIGHKIQKVTDIPDLKYRDHVCSAFF